MIFAYCVHQFPADNIFKTINFLIITTIGKLYQIIVTKLQQIIAAPNLGDFEFHFLGGKAPLSFEFNALDTWPSQPQVSQKKLKTTRFHS